MTLQKESIILHRSSVKPLQNFLFIPVQIRQFSKVMRRLLSGGHQGVSIGRFQGNVCIGQEMADTECSGDVSS